MKKLYWMRECMFGSKGEKKMSCWIKVQTDWDLVLIVKSTLKRGHWLEWKNRFPTTL